MVAPELSRSSTPYVSLAWTSSMKRWVKLLSTNILMAKGIFLQKSLSNETIFTQMSYVWVECFCPIVIIAIVVVLRCTSSFGFGSCSWPLSLASPLSSGLLPHNLNYIWLKIFSLSLCSVTPFFDANCKHKLFQDCPCLCALSAQVGRLQHGNHHRQVRLQVRQQGDHQLFLR